MANLSTIVRCIMTQPLNKQEETKSVPLRQFSLYRPPYEELYSFWWKCMQITLHDKGTQTLNTGPGPDTAFLKVSSRGREIERDIQRLREI